MNTTTDFLPMSDRYRFDFGECTPKKGWAQVDTWQDASYFGTWANPFKLQILTFAEGDVTLKTADTPEEFAAEIQALKAWNDEAGTFHGIDPGFNADLKARFVEIGLGDLLH